MASDYPISVDTLNDPTTSNKLSNPSHSVLHQDENDAIEKLETKLGVGSSTPNANEFLFGTGDGESTWGTLTSAQVIAGVTDETGTGSLVFANTPTLVTPKVDTINENTPANGVTVDSLNIKDGKLNTNNSVVTANITDAAVTAAKMNNLYCFSANSQAAQNSGNAAFAKVLFATEEYDYNNNYASSTYTAPVAGVYHFDANIRTAAANTIFIVSLFKNGAEAKRGMDSRQASVSAQGSVLSADILLAANDTVEIYSFANASLALSVAPAEMYFSGHLVRQTP